MLPGEYSASFQAALLLEEKGALMTKNDFQTIYAMLSKSITALRDDLYQEVARQVKGSRCQLWSGNEWCCKDMKHFAKKFFNATVPNSNESMWGFGTQYMIHGRTLNYCPFCGTPANRAYLVEKDG